MRSNGTPCSSKNRQQHAVVEHVGRRDRVLAIVELGKGRLAVRIDEALLVDAPDALEVAHVVGVLRSEVVRVSWSVRNPAHRMPRVNPARRRRSTTTIMIVNVHRFDYSLEN